MSLLDLPGKIIFGRDKSSLIPPTTPGEGIVVVDNRDVAIVCLSIALAFASMAAVALAADR